MKCRKCGKEITFTDDMVYCPYCSNKLEDASSNNNKNILTKELKISDSFKALIVWLLLCVILVALFSVFRQSLSNIFGVEIAELLTWIVLVAIACVGMYFTLAYVVYNHAKKRNRRAIAWATAFIVFTPILAGLLYLLSWPKE